MKFQRRQGSELASGDYRCRQERHRRSHGKAASRRKRCLDRTRTESLGDPEFVAGMRADRVMGHELIRDLLRKRRIEATINIDRREFLVLARRCLL